MCGQHVHIVVLLHVCMMLNQTTYLFTLRASRTMTAACFQANLCCLRLLLQANRLGITTVISTDSIRHMLRR